MTEASRTAVTAMPYAIPQAQAAQLAAAAAELFDVSGSAKKLDGEIDLNFCITSGQQRFLLKIADQKELFANLDFQTSAMLHILGVDPRLPVPIPLRSRDGSVIVSLEVGETRRLCRLFTWLPGTPLHKVAQSPRQAAAMGALLGRVGRALRSFSHDADSPEIDWNLDRLPELAPMLANQPEIRRPLLGKLFDRHVNCVAPVTALLPRQVVHNDLNPWNVLVDPDNPDSIAGVIDFGDSVRTARLHDLGVACTYFFDGHCDPLASIAKFVSSYSAEYPLLDAECELLIDVIIARMLATLLISQARADLNPENADYLLRNAPWIWRALRKLSEIGIDVVRAQIRSRLPPNVLQEV